MTTTNGTISDPTPPVSYYKLLQLLNSLFDHDHTCSCKTIYNTDHSQERD